MLGGINRYGYVGGDPIRETDPVGLMSCNNSWIDNLVDNFVETQRTADGLVDGLFAAVPAWMTSAATPFTVAFGSGAAARYGGTTLVQEAMRVRAARLSEYATIIGTKGEVIRSIRPFRLFVPGFRTNWVKVGATSLVNGLSVAGAWGFGVLVGSAISATRIAITCD